MIGPISQRAGEYAPSPEAAKILGNIVAQLSSAKPIKPHFLKNPQFLATLPTGELYIDSSMELDTDGWPDGLVRGDPDWQEGTSLRYADANHASLNANKVPYFVLPLPTKWASQFKISLGDYAAVICRDRLAFAVFGDQGPPNKLGEGSIALLRSLGSERIKPDGHVINAGLEGSAITIVFPESGAVEDRKDEATLLAAIDTKGRKCFQSLGGILPSGKPAFEALAAHLGSGIEAIKETLGYPKAAIADNSSADISPFIHSAYSLLLDSNKKAIQVPPEVMSAITDAHEIGGPQLPKEAENRFWKAYGLLNNSIRPAERACTIYRSIFYVVLFVLLVGQFFFISGDYVKSKLLPRDKLIEEIQAKSPEVPPPTASEQVARIKAEQKAYIALTRNLRPGAGSDEAADIIARAQLDMLLVFLSGYLLPMLYGLLGACDVLRQLSDEISKLTYTRDARIRYSLRLSIGLLAGLAVGWFIKPGAGDASLISLSPLALAFIAGYGSDLFFAALDKIVHAFTPATDPSYKYESMSSNVSSSHYPEMHRASFRPGDRSNSSLRRKPPLPSRRSACDRYCACIVGLPHRPR